MRCIVVGVDGIHTVVMLLTFILIIIISIPSPPLFHARLKTLLFCESFPP